jgi:sugar lactone lactonase YvrE
MRDVRVKRTGTNRMFFKLLLAIPASLLIGAATYLAAWPVPIEPVSWKAPKNPGYKGDYAPNKRLSDIERLSIGGLTGPESVTEGVNNRLYIATHEGYIVRLQPDGSRPVPENWVHTGGRPLGLAFDNDGHLIVADAFRGLLSIDLEGTITELAREADGILVRFADDVAVAANGKIYFSDASVKFSAREWGTAHGAVLDVMEHGAHGRLLVYDPLTETATTVLNGLNFANGVAIGHSEDYVLVSETGAYRILRVWIDGPNTGKVEPFIENLPGFPDNITRGRDGRYWIALYSSRSRLLDTTSAMPFWRKVALRLPPSIRPKPRTYGHIIAVDQQGRVTANLQDPTGGYAMNTSVLETDDFIYIGSLVEPVLARLSKIKGKF